MAELKWTTEQEAAINTRGRNILVSAGAGSGKTTVLVARVMKMITDRDDPADIGSLIIMTFTRAAAAQMKDKIYRGIREAIKNDPGNEHLRRQLMAVHNARICTIDSLCMDIVRSNFQEIDIDPMFRIADESESAILRSDVLKELIEEKYKDPDDDFLQFVNFYTDKSDSKIENIILTLYDYAQSHPEPEAWIMDSIVPYTRAGELEYEYSREESIWMHGLKDIVDKELDSIREDAVTGLAISNMDHGPFKYVDIFEKIITFIDSVTGQDAIFDNRRIDICNFLNDWEKAPSIRAADDVDEKLKKDAMEIRKGIREKLTNLSETYFSKDLESAFMDMAACGNVAKAIAELTLEFSRRFLEAKTAKRIADFNDVAHYALRILIKHDENGRMIRDDMDNPIYTSIADTMAHEIKEIIVDEYQDTNLLQEYIINALSSERFTKPDLFMVGDVKQSIYGFRMAVPSLFSDKYDKYATGGENGTRILLNANFRSRIEVIDLVNDIFSQTMIRDIGDINYKDGHELIYGAKYPVPENSGEFIPEFIYIDQSGTAGKECEAYHIARRIEELVGSGLITDGDSGTLRKVRYSDIAILTRTSDNPEIEQELDNRKIPVVKASNKGFFGTFEIRLFTDLLKIIDNPFQDIPFTAVITSPLAGVSSNTLALIRMSYKKEPFSMYRACEEYTDDADLNAFMALLEELRFRNTYMGVCELIDCVLEKSSFESVLEAMPGGESRRANIEMLRDKAEGYARSSFAGLYDFLRYLDQMQDVEKDFGQAQIFEGETDAVNMMTIHKSKGLEFPIVFLARTGKDNNRTDINASIVMDRRIGLGIELRDPVERTVTKTLLMETIRAIKKRDLVAEEMRVLYVALTRAKEKLIITGSMNHLTGAMARWSRELYRKEEQLPYSSILSAGSFMKTMGTALVRHRDAGVIRTGGGADADCIHPKFLKSIFRAELLDHIDVEEERAAEADNTAELIGKIAELYGKDGLSPEAAVIKDQLGHVYPFQASTVKPVKMTASQLADHASMEDRTRWVYKYAEDDGTLTGKDKGTAYHRFFEIMDIHEFSGPKGAEQITQTVKDMIAGFASNGMMTEEQAKTVDPLKVTEFILSDTGKRMISAYNSGTLKREAQFVMGRNDADGELRLIQGIIDAYFEEDGEMVIVDYKTDKNKTDDELISTYREQLEAYSDAVEAATGLKVKEKVIYSVDKGRPVRF